MKIKDFIFKAYKQIKPTTEFYGSIYDGFRNSNASIPDVVAYFLCTIIDEYKKHKIIKSFQTDENYEGINFKYNKEKKELAIIPINIKINIEKYIQEHPQILNEEIDKATTINIFQEKKSDGGINVIECYYNEISKEKSQYKMLFKKEYNEKNMYNIYMLPNKEWETLIKMKIKNEIKENVISEALEKKTKIIERIARNGNKNKIVEVEIKAADKPVYYDTIKKINTLDIISAKEKVEIGKCVVRKIHFQLCDIKKLIIKNIRKIEEFSLQGSYIENLNEIIQKRKKWDFFEIFDVEPKKDYDLGKNFNCDNAQFQSVKTIYCENFKTRILQVIGNVEIKAQKAETEKLYIFDKMYNENIISEKFFNGKNIEVTEEARIELAEEKKKKNIEIHYEDAAKKGFAIFNHKLTIVRAKNTVIDIYGEINNIDIYRATNTEVENLVINIHNKTFQNKMEIMSKISWETGNYIRTLYDTSPELIKKLEQRFKELNIVINVNGKRYDDFSLDIRKM